MTLFRPMLGVSAKDTAKLQYPLYASPKLDGIRAYVLGGVVLSRSGKPIPNQRIQEAYGEFEYFDGELLANNSFQETTSIVMSKTAPIDDVCYHIFDHLEHLDTNFEARLGMPLDFPLSAHLSLQKAGSVTTVPQLLVQNPAELAAFEEAQLTKGYEGVMLRSPFAKYKQGRSTLREQGMLKLKRFEDLEARIIGYAALEVNENPAYVDEVGYTKRSTKKQNKVIADMLGHFHVQDLKGKFNSFYVGGGFTEAQRIDLWQNPEMLLGMIIRVRYFPYGSLDAPRFPVFAGFRDALDLGDSK